MSSMPKEVLREMITGGNLKTSGDLHSYLRDIVNVNPKMVLSNVS